MATHYGNKVTLTCTSEGFPSNYTVITNAYGIPLENQVKKNIGSFQLETSAIVRDIEEEAYVCEVAIYLKDSLIAVKKENLQIKLYSEMFTIFETC